MSHATDRALGWGLVLFGLVTFGYVLEEVFLSAVELSTLASLLVVGGLLFAGSKLLRGTAERLAIPLALAFLGSLFSFLDFAPAFARFPLVGTAILGEVVALGILAWVARAGGPREGVRWAAGPAAMAATYALWLTIDLTSRVPWYYVALNATALGSMAYAAYGVWRAEPS